MHGISTARQAHQVPPHRSLIGLMLEKMFMPMVGGTLPKQCSSDSNAGRTPPPAYQLPASPTLQQAGPAGADEGLARTLP